MKLSCPHCGSKFYQEDMVWISSPDLGCPKCGNHVFSFTERGKGFFGRGGSWMSDDFLVRPSLSSGKEKIILSDYSRPKNMLFTDKIKHLLGNL